MRNRLIFALAACALLSGCWDRIELEDRAFVISMGIDKYSEEGQKEEDETYAFDGEGRPALLVSMALPDVAAISQGKADEKTIAVKKTAGASLSGAMSFACAVSSKKLFFGHIKSCVFGAEALADERLMREALDALERGREISGKVILLSSREEAADILGAQPAGEPFSGIFISKFYQTNKFGAAASFKQTLEDITKSFAETGCALIPEISLMSDELKIGGLAVMKDYALRGFLDDRQTRGLMFIKGLAAGTLINSGDTALRISKNKADTRFYELDGGLCAEIKIKAEGEIEGFIDNGKALDENSLDKLSAEFSRIIEDEAGGAALALKDDFDADCLGFSETLRKYYPGLYSRYCGSGLNLNSLKVDVYAELKIRGAGAKA